MTELEDERRQLKTAIRHLGEGEARIAQQRTMVTTMRNGSPDQRHAQDLLTTLEETLVQWQGHRDAIVERIRTLEAAAAGRGRSH